MSSRCTRTPRNIASVASRSDQAATRAAWSISWTCSWRSRWTIRPGSWPRATTDTPQLCSPTPTIAGRGAPTFSRVNLAGILTASAELFGANTALKLDERELTYWALDLASARLAGLLIARGLVAGQRVAVMLPNVPQLAVAHYGVLRTGASVVPVSVSLEWDELASRLGASGARHLLAWHGVAETADAAARQAGADCLFVTPGEFEKLLLCAQGEREPFECAPSDTAVLLGGHAEVSHERLAQDARALVARLRLTEEDVTLTALPMSELLHATIAAGACMTLIERFDPARARAVIQRDRVTVFQRSPAMCSRLERHPDRARYS